MMDRKARVDNLAKELRLRIASFEVTTMIELLAYRLEDVKSNLVSCSPDDFARLQGEAQAYDKLLKQITRQAIKADSM